MSGHRKSSRIRRPTEKASTASHPHNTKTTSTRGRPPKSKPSSRKTGKRKAITSSEDGSDESSDGIIQIRRTSKKVATKRARCSVEVEEEVIEEDEDTLEATNTVDECSTSLRETHEEDGDHDEPVSFLS
jgi:hypothetical protein